MEEPRSRKDVVPDFLSLKVSLDTNDIQASIYEFLLNKTETSLGALTKKMKRNAEIDTINKRKPQQHLNFSWKIFLKTKNLIDVCTRKEQMSRCINNKMNSVTNLLVTNSMGKKKKVTATVNTSLTFMSCPKTLHSLRKEFQKYG